MTDINLKRLAEDREYWDSVAPEVATHANVSGGFVFWECNPIDKPNAIPRPPKKVQEVEWDGQGLPPVGCECEGDADIRPGAFEPCLVVYHDASPREFEHTTLALFKNSPDGKYSEAIWCSDFRPIRTPKQRVQDELREELTRVIRESDDLAYSFRPDDIADAVIKFYEERYNLEEK